MSNPIDWETLLRDWDALSDETKRKIRDSFLAKTVEALDKYFEENPGAVHVYEKATGKKWPPVEVKPPPVLTGEESARLADFFYEKLKKAGVPMPGRYEGEFASARDIYKSYEENLKLIEDAADRIISFVAPPPPPPVEEKPPPPPKPPEIPRIHATSVDVSKYKAGEYYVMLLNPEKYGDRPIMAITLRTIKEVEEYVARGEEEYLPIALGLYPAPGEEWWEELAEELKHDAIIYWTTEDVVWSPNVEADRVIWHKKYTREDLEPLKVDELRRILAVKGLSPAGKKAELIDRILGIKPPPKPPVEKPPEVPPPKPPVVVPPPVEMGLTKADETYLHDVFLAKLMEADYSHSKARGHLPEFRVELRRIREDVKDVARDEAVRRGRDFVEGLVERILARKPPVAPPVARPPEVAPPVVPPILIPLPVVPPPGVIRRLGIPWAWHLCPACVGEKKPEEACKTLRSPYLENRLRRLGLPTSDPLFFKLCLKHKREYGGAFEYFPRDTIEFWVGEAVMKGEVDIATLVGLGITDEYVRHCVRVYEENKELAVQ